MMKKETMDAIGAIEAIDPIDPIETIEDQVILKILLYFIPELSAHQTLPLKICSSYKDTACLYHKDRGLLPAKYCRDSPPRL